MHYLKSLPEPEPVGQYGTPCTSSSAYAGDDGPYDPEFHGYVVVNQPVDAVPDFLPIVAYMDDPGRWHSS